VAIVTSLYSSKQLTTGMETNNNCTGQTVCSL
jgi:hypothetical protein